MTSLQASFHRHLRAAVLSCALPEKLLHKSDPFALLGSIRVLCDAPEVAEQVRLYADVMVTFLRKQVAETPMPLEAVAASMFAHRALAAVAHRYSPKLAPLVHHWIPRTYLKRWAPGKRYAGDKRIPVAVAYPGQEDRAGELVTDSVFAHPRRNHRGFYELELEFFFSLIESDFGLTAGDQWVVQQREPWASAVSFIFMAAQLARNPKADGTHERHTIPVLRAMMKSMEHFEAPQSMLLDVEEVQAFAPWATPRLTRTTLGDVFVFPVGPHRVAVVYSGAMPQAELVRATARARASRIAEARRKQAPLYGVTATDV